MGKVEFRFIKMPKTGAIYLRMEDVIEFILTLSESEETDVRNRLETAAKNISTAMNDE